jgi:hypothetical protein
VYFSVNTDVRRQGRLLSFFGLDIPASDLQIFNQHFWCLAFKSSQYFSLGFDSRPAQKLSQLFLQSAINSGSVIFMPSRLHRVWRKAGWTLYCTSCGNSILHLLGAGRNIAKLLFVTFNFSNFIGQQLWADTATFPALQPSPSRYRQP